MNEYQQHWVFEWVIEPSRDITEKNKTLEGWRITTRPHQTPAQDSYLIAHDVFHHHPDDKGTYADEVFSLGAEAYMNGAEKTFEQQRSSLQSSWFSIMALTLDQGSKWLSGLILSNKHPVLELTEQEEAFKKIYIESIQELKLDFYVNDDYEIWDRLLSGPQINKAASKMASGHRWAQKTYPDPQHALKLFNQVRQATERVGVLGEKIIINQNGQFIHIEHELPQFETNQRLKIG